MPGAGSGPQNANFIHRDVKAQNVMREAGGRIVLMDFGAGAGAGQDVALAGTPVYLAPELFTGAAPSVASDLYALGVLLFHLVTGEFPVVGRSLDELRQSHDQPRRLLRDIRADLPDAFVRTVDQALVPDPAGADPPARARWTAFSKMRIAPARRPGWSEGAISRAGPSKHVAQPWSPVTVIAAAALVVALTVAWVWRPAPPRAAVAVKRNSLAVLPFRNLTAGSADNDYLTEGITDDLWRTWHCSGICT